MGEKGQVWAIFGDAAVLWDPDSRTWGHETHYGDGGGRSITVDPNGDPWVVTAGGSVAVGIGTGNVNWLPREPAGVRDPDLPHRVIDVAHGQGYAGPQCYAVSEEKPTQSDGGGVRKELWRFSPSSEVWVRLSLGSMPRPSRVAAGIGGADKAGRGKNIPGTWVIDGPFSRLYTSFANTTGGPWYPYGGYLSGTYDPAYHALDIGVGSGPALLSTDGRIWKRNDKWWVQHQLTLPSGVKGQRVDVGPDGSVWVVADDGKIYGPELPVNQLSEIAVGSEGSVFGIDLSGTVREWDGQSWQAVHGAGTHIAVDHMGNPWVLDTGRHPWRWDPDSGGFIEVGGGLLDIAAGADGSVFGIALDNTIRKWDGTWWQHVLPASASHLQFTYITVDNQGNPWVLDTDRHPWRYSLGDIAKLGGGLLDIAAGADVTVFGIALDNTVRKWDGTWWQPVNGAGDHIVVDPSGNPWVVAQNNTVWRWDSAAGGFVEVK